MSDINKNLDVDSIQEMHDSSIVNQEEHNRSPSKRESRPEVVVDTSSETLHHVSSGTAVICEINSLGTPCMQIADDSSVVSGESCGLPQGKDLKLFIEDGCDTAMAQDSVEEEVCCICLEEYTGDNPALYGECKHHFHLPCLMNWKQRSNICPMCSAETLHGLAEDNDPPRRLQPIDDDVLTLMLQRQRGWYGNRHVRHHNHLHLNRQRELGRPRVQNVQLSGATLQVLGGGSNEQNTSRALYNQENALNQRQRRVSARANGDAVITGVSQNVESSASVKTSRHGRCVRSDDTNKSSVLSFFNKLFCCCKK
ncbi:zinc finger protein [Trypanosoma melophagium]|uniref:zinc finger protein n=1 Tax=Trypanosoma melophagium TaxID=715481 RepID=UPI00351A9E14|nr:zinc finger protein [Trypanosoma melophagium]